MASIQNIGNGVGLIYIVDVDGTTVLNSLANDKEGVRSAKTHAVQSQPLPQNISARGSVTISIVPAGSESVTNVNISGVNQIDAAIVIDTATETAAQVADKVGNAINGFTPAIGPDYTAIVVDDKVNIYAPVEYGSGVNGALVAFVSTNPAAIVATVENIDGGADAGEVYDESFGFRFFLDASASAAVGDISGAVEVTKDLVGNNRVTFVDFLSVASGSVSPERKGVITSLEVDTENQTSSDDLSIIVPTDFRLGDIFIIQGKVEGRKVTVKDGSGNIQLKSGDFITSTKDQTLGLQLLNGPTTTPTWFEIFRSGDNIGTVADYRNANFPFGVYGKDTITAAASGTVTLRADKDEEYQVLSGIETLTGDYEIALSATNAKAGDRFFLSYEATITLGVHQLTLFGLDIPQEAADTQGWFISAYYDGSAWNANFIIGVNQPSSTQVIYGSLIKDDVVTVDKLTEKHELEVLDVSADATSEIGDHVIEMPYKGQVDKIVGYVSKDIEASDDMSITAKDNASAIMGTLTFAGGTAVGNAQTSSPTTNNTFIAGDVLTFTTAKTTAGGKVKISLKIKRTT